MFIMLLVTVTLFTCPSGETTAISWRDNKLFTLLTSLPSAPDATTVINRKGKDEIGKFYRIRIGQPEPISVYGVTMKGVDLQ